MTTTTTADHIAELHREIEMRRRVYPGRVKAGKMTQVSADKKTELIRGIAALFSAAALEGIQPIEMRLPFYEPDGSPFPVTSLEPHIKELYHEISYRVDRIERLIGASREHAQHQLRLIREILDILSHIQGKHTNRNTQLTIF